ncbi:BatA domain-containing protein [Algibacter luteus]|uniref:N-terminal double-transmembrane domain-containing protein n=1 Tax=Algibacter luteus TaxID=1178825 RepID=A0A1M6EB95_9FLAO|nr:BatA domain-containing protein [Algibacter luteus]SHI82745.1 N-terminal double-transmembrane domain-containing protein [Algibacter luteus]
MQFKHPEILYALFLLLIPIIVHLFQLRKFQKVYFTNVAFLKEATWQTRKSSQIKKWLVLLTRLFLLAALVFAFAQPFTSKTTSFKKEKETVIYLDNSFSMQTKGNQGELFKRAIQDVIANVSENENITLITNDKVFKKTSIKAIKNELLTLNYTSSVLSKQAAYLKCKSFLSNKTNTLNNVILISDFQEDNTNLNILSDSTTNINFVKLNPLNKNNIAIDSVFISKVNPDLLELKVVLKNSGVSVENLPVSLFNNDKLIAKTSLEIEQKSETIFTLPNHDVINGKITINDASLQFDNTLYFNINEASKINVLSINDADDSYLKRIYSITEFNYVSTQLNTLNYNLIDSQHLIILNELKSIPLALNAALKQFTRQGGNLVIVPSIKNNNESYNTFLTNYDLSFNEIVNSEKRITSINYAHPLYNNGVFEKQVKNFQYPKVNSFYTLASKNLSAVLQFEDEKLFLGQRQNVYLFTASINQVNSSFKISPLIVPTLYNIAKQSFKIPELYYIIGKENAFDVDTKMQQDAVLSLVKEDISMIPKQQYFNNKVVINTLEDPSVAGTYQIKNKNEIIKNVSYNYSRNESQLAYKDLSALEQVTVSNSITEVFDTIKSDTKVNALWKWFVIFALALLIIEMLILKFFK